MPGGRGVRVDGSCLSARLNERGTNFCAKFGRILPELMSERERRLVVVRQEFGFIVALACELLDPGRGSFVLVRTVGPADLRIGDVTGECVGKVELTLAVDRGLPYTLYQLLSLDRM